MPRYIDADKKIHIQVFDEEHEEYLVLEKTIEECLDSYTDEGCPNPADVQEVKHAHWGSCGFGTAFGCDATPKYYICSNCHMITDLYSIYCPMCGAKMDEEENKL